MDAIRALIGHNVRFMVAIGNVIGHNVRFMVANRERDWLS